MSNPVRLQLSRRKGFNLQALSLATNGLPAVNVARPSMWGNRWKAGIHSNRLGRVIATADEAVALYAELAWPEGHHRAWVREHLAARNLACWCHLGSPCHADVLLELANKPVCEAVEPDPVRKAAG